MRSFAAGLAVTMLVTCSFAADAKPPVVGSAKFPDLKASNLESREINSPQAFSRSDGADRFPVAAAGTLDTGRRR